MAISGTDWLEVPTIYKADFLGLCKGISLENMPRNMVLTYLHVLDPEIPIEPSANAGDSACTTSD